MTNNLVRLSETRARALTEEIRSTVERLWQLLEEAYVGDAHTALGYASWEEYVGAEFGMSRQRSYQLLNQASVIRELSEAAGIKVSTSVDINENEARRIRPVLDATRNLVSERVKGKRQDRRPEIVREVVAEVAPPAPIAIPSTARRSLQDLLILMGRLSPERAAKLIDDDEYRRVMTWARDLQHHHHEKGGRTPTNAPDPPPRGTNAPQIPPPGSGDQGVRQVRPRFKQ